MARCTRPRDRIVRRRVGTRHRALPIAVFATLLAACVQDHPTEAMQPAPEPIERADLVDDDDEAPPEQFAPSSDLPPGWPERLVLGVVPEGDSLDFSALATIGELLSSQLGIPVRASVHEDTSVLAHELADRRVDVALLDLPHALEDRRLSDPETTLQVVRRGRTDALTAWISTRTDEWCPDTVTTTSMQPGRRVRICEHVDASGARDDSDILARLATGDLTLVRPTSSSTLSRYLDHIIAELEGEAREGMTIPEDGPVADDSDDAEDPGVVATATVGSSSLLEALAEGERRIALVRLDGEHIDDPDLVVVGWGPPVPQPVVVLRPGLSPDVAQAVNASLTAVMTVPRGAAAFLDLAGVEGWELLDDESLASAREIIDQAAS